MIPSISKDALKDRKRILTQGDLSKIVGIKNREYDRDILPVLLGALCGLSVKETLNLRHEHIDFNYSLLKITDTNISRIIPIPEQVLYRIIAVRDTHLSTRYVVPNSADAEKPCDPITLYRALEKILALVGSDENHQLTFSWLRYTFIEFLLFRGVEPDTIDILCGYRNTGEAEISYEIYEKLKKAIRAVERGIISWVQLPRIV